MNETGESLASPTMSVSGVTRALWQAKYQVLTIVLLFTLCGVGFSLLAPSWYRATVLMVPAAEKTADGLSGQFSGIAGLAGLAGIRVGGGNTAEAIGVLKSRELTKAFIAEQDLMPVMFADEWDAVSKKWRSSSSEDWPDLREGVRFFDENIRFVREDKVSGLVTLVVEWKDPDLAAKWANMLVQRVNSTMRSRALVEAEANVAYLRRELSSTTLVTLQTAISRLLETELQKLMLARGNEEFAFRVIDPAQTPQLRSWPPRTLISALSLVLGGVTAVLFVLFRRSLGRRDRIPVNG